MFRDPTLVLDKFPLGMVGKRRENGLIGWSYVRDQKKWSEFQNQEGVLVAPVNNLQDFAEYVRSIRPTAPRGAVWFMIIPDGQRKYDQRTAEYNAKNPSSARPQKTWSEMEGGYNDRIVEFPTFTFLDLDAAADWLRKHPEDDHVQIYRGSGVFATPSDIGNLPLVDDIVDHDYNRAGEFENGREKHLRSCISSDWHLYDENGDQTDLAIEKGRRMIPLAGGFKICSEKGTGRAFFTLRRRTKKFKSIDPRVKRKTCQFTIANLDDLGRHLLWIFERNFLDVRLEDPTGKVSIEPHWYCRPKWKWYEGLTKEGYVRVCNQAILFLQNLKHIDLRYEYISRRHAEDLLPHSRFAHNAKLLEKLEPFGDDREALLRVTSGNVQYENFYKLVIPLYDSILKAKRNERARAKRAEAENERLRLIKMAEPA